MPATMIQRVPGKADAVLDPAIPASLDGLRAGLEMAGHSFEVTYRVKSTGCGPRTVSLDGRRSTLQGAAMVRERLTDGLNRLSIELG
jgi:1,2-beta-oligoglucan phosphorylase